MEKSKYKLIQTLKMKKEKKESKQYTLLKNNSKKITILKAYLKISSFR